VETTFVSLGHYCSWILFWTYGKVGRDGIGYCCRCYLSSFSEIDRIQRFKDAGFEVEMRKPVDEAYATIENLKALAKPLLLITFETITMSGRYDGIEPNQRHKLAAEIEQNSKSLSLHNQELQDAQAKLYRYHTWNHYSMFIDEVIQSARPIVDDQAEKSLFGYMKDSVLIHEDILEPTGEKWEVDE
jgi:hypothetical protein